MWRLQVEFRLKQKNGMPDYTNTHGEGRLKTKWSLLLYSKLR